MSLALHFCSPCCSCTIFFCSFPKRSTRTSTLPLGWPPGMPLARISEPHIGTVSTQRVGQPAFRRLHRGLSVTVDGDPDPRRLSSLAHREKNRRRTNRLVCASIALHLLFAFLFSKTWLYIWDFIGLNIFLAFVEFVISERRWYWFATLFAVAILNRERTVHCALDDSRTGESLAGSASSRETGRP